MSSLLTRVQFAELAGVTPAAMTKACAPGKALAPACNGKRIDISHPAAIAYLAADRGKPIPTAKPTPVTEPAKIKQPEPTPVRPAPTVKRGPKTKVAKATPPPAPAAAPAATAPATTAAPTGFFEQDGQLYPENIREFLDWTLAQLVRKFGTETAFLDWLKATKLIEEIQAKQLDNAAAKGLLVDRHLVKTAIIDPIDETHRRLLADGSKTIGQRVATMAKAGRTDEEIEKDVADTVSSFLRPMKDRVARALRNMGEKNGK